MRHYVSVMLLLLAMMAHAADGKWAGTWATAIEPVGKNRPAGQSGLGQQIHKASG